jgi:urate oxidase
MKQTTYILAKQNPVNPPELFASILSSHFISTYPHIHRCTINIVGHRWTRMSIDDKPHPYSFWRDGSETRDVQAVATSSTIDIRSALSKLAVFKSTGSAFYGFHRDEYTALPETWDRILSTDVDCGWKWNAFANLDEVKENSAKFDPAFTAARDTTMKIFAEDSSASVQNTMYKMCESIMAQVPGVEAVDYKLPNKHYFEIDLSWHKGLKNTGKDAEVYAPQSDPNGLITCTVARNKPKSV